METVSPSLSFRVVIALLLRPVRRFVFGPPDATRAARAILDRALRLAFRLFRNEEFRRAMRFDAVAEKEHDFVFNELVATSVALPMLITESMRTLTDPGPGRVWFQDLEEALRREYTAMLREFGIPDDQIATWTKLIDLRLEEFHETRLLRRDAFPEIGEGNPWTKCCAISCLFHIRHGESIKDDPALPLLLHALLDCSLAAMRTITRYSLRV